MTTIDKYSVTVKNLDGVTRQIEVNAKNSKQAEDRANKKAALEFGRGWLAIRSKKIA